MNNLSAKPPSVNRRAPGLVIWAVWDLTSRRCETPSNRGRRSSLPCHFVSDESGHTLPERRRRTGEPPGARDIHGNRLKLSRFSLNLSFSYR